MFPDLGGIVGVGGGTPKTGGGSHFIEKQVQNGHFCRIKNPIDSLLLQDSPNTNIYTKSGSKTLQNGSPRPPGGPPAKRVPKRLGSTENPRFRGLGGRKVSLLLVESCSHFAWYFYLVENLNLAIKLFA